METNLPVIELELNSGSFRIKTDEAIFQITVRPDSSLGQIVDKIVDQERKRDAAPAQPAKPAGASDDPFYQEISQEMYAEIGRLARQLSLSIKDIPGEHFQKVDIEQTGRELEGAKEQLEDIVQMTEKATMEIMDLTEAMSEDCKSVQTHLDAIMNLDIVEGAQEGADWGDEFEASPDSASVAPSLEWIGNLLDQENRLRELIAALPTAAESAAPAEPPDAPAEPRTITRYQFDIDVLFQTLYELCTNETVKSHIKAMRTDQATAFDAAAVQKLLADLAPTVDVEDNFFNFPISAVLKGLFGATPNEKYKQVLKKMNQTVESIFLDTILPVEGQVTQEVSAPAPQPAAAVAPSAQTGLAPEQIETMLSVLDVNIGRLSSEKERLEQILDTPEASSATESEYTSIKKEDRERIVAAVQEANQVVQRIMSHSTRIMEALSFQDLSGQRIFKIVRLMSDVQVQLLSLLVSFGAKLKRKLESKDIMSAKQAERMAQEEVDKMLERIAPIPSALEGPAAEGRLDQDAVNNLLADLGF